MPKRMKVEENEEPETEDYTNFTLRIPNTMKKKLRRVAAMENRAAAAQVRRWVIEGLAKYDSSGNPLSQ